MGWLEQIRDWVKPATAPSSPQENETETLEMYRNLTAALNLALADAKAKYDQLQNERVIQLGAVVAAVGGEIHVQQDIIDLVQSAQNVTVDILDDYDGVRLVLSIDGEKMGGGQ